MRIVLDTNIFITIFSPTSANHSIFKALIKGEITLAVTTDILDEYAEITERFLGVSQTNDLLELLDLLPNVERYVKYFRWDLMINDPDDDKFVDCAVACNAKFIVTEDKHFNILKQTPFPIVSVIGVKDFLKLLKS